MNCPRCHEPVIESAEEEELIAEIHANLIEQIDRNEWALFRWGKSWADCTEAERHEAMRLRSTPLGGGFEPGEG